MGMPAQVSACVQDTWASQVGMQLRLARTGWHETLPDSPTCAQAVGAKRLDALPAILARALLFLAAHGLPFSVLLAFMPRIFAALGEPPAVTAYIAEYVPGLQVAIWLDIAFRCGTPARAPVQAPCARLLMHASAAQARQPHPGRPAADHAAAVRNGAPPATGRAPVPCRSASDPLLGCRCSARPCTGP